MERYFPAAAVAAEKKPSLGPESNHPSAATEGFQGADAPPTHAGDLDRDGRVLLIDVYGLLYRCYHSAGSVRCPLGREIGAVYGVASRLLEVVSWVSPSHLVAVWDRDAPSFRSELYPEYKAHREPMPVALRQQLPVLEATLDAFGIPAADAPGFEADDVVATLVETAAGSEAQFVILSNDKDFRQLVGPRVRLLQLPGYRWIDSAAIAADWGIYPEQCVDFQALVGDAVDNVPGVRLFGPKLASQLLRRFGTLDAILENTDAITGPKRRENLRAGRQQAQLSRELVRLRRDAPLRLDWQSARCGQAEPAIVEAILEELGVDYLVRRAVRVFAAPTVHRG